MNARALGFALAAALVVALVVSTLVNRVDTPDPVRPPASAGNPRRHLVNESAASKAERVAPPAGVVARSASPVAAPPSLVAAVPTEPSAPVFASGPLSEVDGGLAPYTVDREGIRSAIRAKLPDIQECYAAWLEQNPTLAGRIMVGFEVSADNAGTGEVTRIEVLDGGIGHPFMEGCILNAFQEIRFEEPPGGGTIEVHFPIQFESPLADGG